MPPLSIHYRLKRCLAIAFGSMVAFTAPTPADAAAPNIGSFDAVRGGVLSLAEGSAVSSLRSGITSAYAGASFLAASVLTSGFLDTVDAVLLSSTSGDGFNSITALDSGEQAALENFVLGGGVAMIFTELNNGAHSAANSSLLGIFGLTTTGNIGGTVTVTDPPGNPVTGGPFGEADAFSVINSGFFNSLGPDAEGLGTLSTGFGLAWIPPDALGAGSGAVIFVSDSTPLANGFISSDIISIVNNSIALAGGGGPSDVVYVNIAATPGGDGLSWDTAFQFLQDALSYTADHPEITQVWVAQGTYKPDQNDANPSGTGDRSESFTLQADLAIYGGFAGGETALEQRDPGVHPTILSGDLLGDDALPFVNRDDNSYHVIFAPGDLSDTCILDGFTIRGGHADGDPSDEDGGAILFDFNSAPVINQCYFFNNYAAIAGGAVFIDDASPVFTNCEFDQNNCDVAGGVMQVDGSESAPRFTSCIFANNTASNGGVATLVDGNVLFENCFFTGNASAGIGGAIQNLTNPEFHDCYFGFNQSTDEGGAVTNSGAGANARFLRCSFLGNSALVGAGGAMYNSSGAAPQIVSCSFIQNSTSDNDAGAILNASAFALIDQSLFVGNHSAVDGGAIHNISSTVFINNCTFWSNTADNLGGAIANFGGSSVATRNSILRGSTANGSPNELSGSGHNVTFSNIQGGAGGAGNINVDPRFVDADGADDTPGTADDDLRLIAGSPCIDAASNALVPADTLDLDGDANTTEPLPLDIFLAPRFHDDTGTPDTGSGTPPIVDMGVFEFQGTTQPPSPYPFFEERTVIASPAGIAAAADLDRDGDMDLVALSSPFVEGSDLIIHLNDGAQPPNFTFAEVFPCDIDDVRIIAADFDNDGDNDLASGSSTDDLLLVYDNQDLDPLLEISIANSFSGPTAIAAGDVNRDGLVDIVVSACGDQSLTWFENTGGFAFTQRIIDAADDCASDVTLADLDRDGDLDVLATLSDLDKTIWYESNGADPPSWTERNVVTGLTEAGSVIAADLDFDGDQDVISASPQHDEILWSENNGDAPPSFTQRTLAAVDTGASHLSIADVDLDGDPDVAAYVLGNQAVTWFRNDGESPPSFSANIVEDATGSVVTQFFAELDRDGDPEIVGTYDSGNLVYYENFLNHSTAAFSPGGSIIGYADGPTAAVPGDVDGDGKNDVIVSSFFDDTISWFENPGVPPSGPTAWEKHVVVSSASGSFRPDGPACVAAGDLDCDGDLDLASVSIIDGRIQWYENNSAGVFTPRLVTTGSQPSFIRVADLNADGDPDLLVSLAGSDSVVLCINNGNQPPSFVPQTVATGLDSIRSAWEGDLDGDGDIDFATASYADDTFAWHESNGAANPTFTEHVISNLADGAAWCQPFDVDRDGDLDILAASLLDNTVEVYENDGDPNPVFTPSISDSGVFGASSVWGLDLDNDGDQDLVASARHDDEVLAYENDDGVLEPNVISSILHGIQWAALADVTLDSFPDIITASFADDKIKIFDNQPGQCSFTDSVSTAPSILFDNDTNDLFRLNLNHGGRSADTDIEFAGLSIRLERPDGTPLTVPEASALFNAYAVFADTNESGSFELGLDTSIASAGDGAYNGSAVHISIPDDEPEARLSFFDGNALFFFAVTLESNASAQPQNSFRAVFDPSDGGTTVEDADHDVPITIGAPRTLTTQTVTIEADVVSTLPDAGGLAIPCSADFDHDGLVASSDLNMLLSSWGAHVAPGTSGDATGDGFVTSIDLNILLAEWGANCL